MLNLAIVVGSVRAGRQSHKAAYYLAKKLQERKDVNIKLIDLLKYEIPMFEERYGRVENASPSLKEAAEILQHADGIILQSPEYHASISGALKNFLDYFLKELTKKPIGVAAASGGKFGGINASAQMQQIIFGVGSFPMPTKFIVPFVSQAFDDEYNVLNEDVEKSAEKFINEFVWFANAINNAKLATASAEAA